MTHATLPPHVDSDVLYADPILDDVVALVVQFDKASSSILQRKFSIGYARAARLLDILEQIGVVEEGEGARPRKVLLTSIEEYEKKKETFTTPTNTQYVPNSKHSDLPDVWNALPKNGVLTEILSHITPSHPLTLPTGWDGKTLITHPLLKYPNVLLSGNPQSNKHAYLHAIMTTLLATNTPTTMRCMFIDTGNTIRHFDAIEHLITPIITTPKPSLSALRWFQEEIASRNARFIKEGCTNFAQYQQTTAEPLPSLVLVISGIDCLIAQNPSETKNALSDIVARGADTGIYLLATTDSLSPTVIPSVLVERTPLIIELRATQKQSVLTPEALTLSPDEAVYRTVFMDEWKHCRIPILSQEEISCVTTYWKNRR